MVVAATFSVAATDHLFIEDFDIMSGETALVEILLENEVQYTAFQVDLYLPEGLTVDEGSVVLTGRKASDHTISTCVLVNGAVRIMSYSMMINPYSGNSGALATFMVTASETLDGSVDFLLKNIRLTTMSGQDVALDDVHCTVTTTSPFVPSDVNGDGHVNISDVTAMINHLLRGTASSCPLAAVDVNGDGQANISDVTALINKLLRGN